jgi:hypothetical protein
MHSTDLSQNQEQPTNSLPRSHSPPINSLPQSQQTKQNPNKSFDETRDNADFFHRNEALINHEDKTSIRNKPPITMDKKNISFLTVNDVNTEPMDKRNGSSSPSPTVHPPLSETKVDPANVVLGIFHLLFIECSSFFLYFVICH